MNPREFDKGKAAATKKASMGRISVTSTKAGATVFLNRKKVGVTPWTSGDLAPGRYTVMVTREGHKAAQKSVGVGKGARLNVKLDPSPIRSPRKVPGARPEPATRDNTRMNPKEFDKRKAASEKKKRGGR